MKGWAGDAHLPWTHGDKPRRGGSLSLFMDTPVATGLILRQDKNQRKTLNFNVVSESHVLILFSPFNPGLQLGRCGRYMFCF